MLDAEEIRRAKKRIQRQNWINFLWRKWVNAPEKMLKEEMDVLRKEMMICDFSTGRRYME